MNRLDKIFTDLKQKNEKALVGFVTAGDPGIPESLEIILKMCDAGLNILELGTPFSDPTADGPVIQRSSARALDKGIKLKDVLEMTYTIRQKSDIPIILFGYYNPIHAFGIPSFYKAATKAGADGVLIVDLPPEESDEMTSQWPDNNLPLIRLVAPTTPKERMAKIAATASGFLYLVSKTGVTGSDGLDTDNIGSYVESLRNVSKLPICVGFGISSPDDVAAISTIADGVVIGSAFERLIEDNLDSPDIATILADKVSEFKNATIMK
ncbi:MAG: tryptophan synthase subunit alpha [Deltaproteobacteria bacterium]|nr:tryptophan synthase subunit alpha [Deltaproteobacteria bacterium]MBW1848890.1 tryptophan synthase subunit alpha [Deltaproteobacteria bacterium]MBW1984285.1 tryptophan synthase subunit alpha [Deltaproteobacteria bacterium]MBW2365675.1 tryptophan synthase subunit alpha [Deltaproteobacteria bacterium]